MYYDEKKKKHKYVASDWYEFDEEKEKNFYYFLNQRGRNIKPVHDYWIMVFPVMLTLIFDKVYEYIQSMGNIKIDSGWDIVVGIVMYLAMMAVCLFAICKLLKEVFKTSEPDYKVIIDNMIKERKKDL